VGVWGWGLERGRAAERGGTDGGGTLRPMVKATVGGTVGGATGPGGGAAEKIGAVGGFTERPGEGSAGAAARSEEKVADA
jgi:hypothetical protein